MTDNTTTNIAEQEIPEFSEGVCGDGIAILRDGVRMTVSEVLSTLRAGAAAEARIKQFERELILNGNRSLGPLVKALKDGDIFNPEVLAAMDALAKEIQITARISISTVGQQQRSLCLTWSQGDGEVGEKSLLRCGESPERYAETFKSAMQHVKALGVDELAEAWEAVKPEDGVTMSESTALKYKQRAQDARDFAANLRVGRNG